MNNTYTYTIITGISFAIGLMTWCIMNEYIIIQITQPTTQSTTHIIPSKKNKLVTFVFWNKHRWHTETDTLVLSSDTQETIKAILTHWLDLLREEQCIPINVMIQSVLIAHDTHVAFISFTANPFNPNAPTLHALLCIKGLLKTLKENTIPIHAIMLMENHKPLEQTQLDFTKPWPLNSLDHLPSIY